MSRINCVPPRELSGPHLIAEYRELPRVFGIMRRKQAQGLCARDLGLPRRYCLGTGHLSFFLDKGAWLLRRQQALIDEMQRRGYHPTFTNPATLAHGLDPSWLGDWRPTATALRLNRSRLAERHDRRQHAEAEPLTLWVRPARKAEKLPPRQPAPGEQ